ncbi:MAG: UDP-2,3-diacylglucosamine diphosphatase LpxI [Hyphomicrobiaceae bacterium]|nr:UDP-2,3-diacylglucosamine diphosphatase LpxI [Hyphomicrobiaceae bacterium]
MTSGSVVRLGLLVGGGRVPEEIAEAAVARGWPVHVVGIDGEVDGTFPGLPVTRVNWGQIGRMTRAFRENGCTHLVIVGRVSRPDMTKLKPDFGLVQAIPSILRIMASGGDDGVLRGVVRFFEGHGLTVLGPADVAPELAIGAGAIGTRAPSAEDEIDIAKGLSIVRLLGAFDVGQSVVVRGGAIIAIEGAEGTDRMLSRVAPTESGARGVLVKRPKPQQDMRVDMPVIGPDTISNSARAGLAGVAVLAGQVLITQRQEVVARAEQEGLFVAGVTDGQAVSGHAAPRGKDKASGDNEDIARGAAILRVLQPFVASRSVVVARKYVLAIESGEGVEAVLRRVGGLRQWGSQHTKKRSGFAVLGEGQRIEASHVDLAVAAGLRGLAAAGPDSVSAQAKERAGATGLALAAADVATRSRS